jgi:hypothetical protein
VYRRVVAYVVRDGALLLFVPREGLPPLAGDDDFLDEL